MLEADEDGVATVRMGYWPRPWQERARAAFRRFNVLVVHRGAGKTILACATLMDSALRTRREGARYAYIAPLRVQAKGIAWDTLKGWARAVVHDPDEAIKETELSITLPGGSRIVVLGADNPDSLRGLHLDGVVLDEVAQMRPSVWGEIVRPALAARKGWALFIGTPKGINLFSELYFQALEAEMGDWAGALWTVDDTGVFSADEIESAKRTMTENQVQQELYCDFSASVDNQLITLDMVLQAEKRAARPEDFKWKPKIIGVDVARYGDDLTAIARRHGPMLYPITYMRKRDNMEVAAEVARQAMEWGGVEAIFVDNGRGEGVIDRLTQLQHRPIGVDFGGTKGVRAGYRRHRDQMYGDTAEWIRTVGCLPRDERLRAALCSVTYSYNNVHNLMEVESKDQLKARGLPSPDPADALGLTFAYPVAPRVEERYVHHALEVMRDKTVFDDIGWRG